MGHIHRKREVSRVAQSDLSSYDSILLTKKAHLGKIPKKNAR